jgi:hypothetical protein
LFPNLNKIVRVHNIGQRNIIIAFAYRFETDGYCKSSLLVLMASVSPINVVLPSRMVAYLLASLPPPLANILPQTDIAILQVSILL